MRRLGEQLQTKGVKVLLDQWDIQPGADLPNYMETSVREADFVLLICTPLFAKKANLGKGAVGYEKSIVTGEISHHFSSSNKLVPILRNGSPPKSLPSYLKSKVFIDFLDDNVFSSSFDKLLRHMHESPLYVRPPLGSKPPLEPFKIHVEESQETISPKTCLGSKIPKIPIALPENFIDREKYLEEIKRKIKKEKSVYIFGMCGVGKSALATTAYDQVNEDFKQTGFIYYDIKDEDSEELISMIADEFNISIQKDLNLKEKKHKLRSYFNGHRALIFLDNIKERQIVEDLIDALSGFTFLVTSRKDISVKKFHPIKLEILSEEDAIEMFLKICDKYQTIYKDDTNVRKICLILGYLPLAIELMAKRVKFNEMDFKDALEKLTKTRNIRKEEAYTEILKSISHAGNSILYSFDFTFGLLNKESKQLFVTLGVFDGNDFSEEAAIEISVVPRADIHLQDLINLSLIKPYRGRYTLHPLFKLYARAKLTELSEHELYEIKHRQAIFFFRYAKLHRHPLHELDSDSQNILGCLKWCNEQRKSSSLVDFLVNLLGVNIYEVAQVIYLLARLYKRQGDTDLAAKYYEECECIAKSDGITPLEGACLRSKGEIFLKYKNDLQRGLNYINKALEVLKSAPEDDIHSLKERIFTLNLLIEYYMNNRNNCRKRMIKKLAQDSLYLRDKIPENERDPSEGLFYAAARLIEIYKDEEKTQEAYNLLQKERDNLTGVDLASSLGYVGCMMLKEERFTDAKELFKEAFYEYDKIGNRGGCAWIKKCLGRLYFSFGDNEGAVDSFKQAVSFRKEAGERHYTAAALIYLSHIYFKTNQEDEAKNKWQDFLKNYKSFILNIASNPEKEHISDAICSFCKELIRAKNYSFAFDVMRNAEKLFERAICPGGISNINRLFGDYWLAKKNKDKAKKNYDKAVALNKKCMDFCKMASTLEEIGNSFFLYKQTEEAWHYWQSSLKLYKEQNNENGQKRIKSQKDKNKIEFRTEL